jgi:hypothetical protein
MMGFIWFWLVAVMIVGYVVLDGFDLGVGVLHLFLPRTEQERRTTLASIGPVWDGNEVWLLAGGGTLYFAFPLLYASAFSGFYLPLMIVLWLLILRGVSLELRNHIDVGVWRALLDGLFGLSSALLTIFFGAALANVLRGVPLQADGYFFLPLWTNWQPGVHPGILDWYTVIGGLVAFVALTLHGALWLTIKTSGALASGLARSSLRYGAFSSLSRWSALPQPSLCVQPVWAITSNIRLRSLFPWESSRRWQPSGFSIAASIRSKRSSRPASICFSCWPAPAGDSIQPYCLLPRERSATLPFFAPYRGRTRLRSAWPGGPSAWLSLSATSSSSTASFAARSISTPPATDSRGISSTSNSVLKEGSTAAQRILPTGRREKTDATDRHRAAADPSRLR